VLILTTKIGINGAMQKFLCCGAAMHLLHVEGHNPLNFDAI
jgi:hypothetical protein